MSFLLVGIGVLKLDDFVCLLLLYVFKNFGECVEG